MTPSDYLVSALATVMFNEPKEDSLLGFTACGLVIRNRVLAGWHGGNWLTLLNKHDTFSANPPATPRIYVFGDPNHDTIFRRCLGVAENIFAGRERDLCEGAKWYGRLDNCSDWFKENIVQPRNPETGLQDHAFIAKIGAQSFFL